MPNESPVNETHFQLLLHWLDPNSEAAGDKYERIRRRLIRIFVCRGCCDAESLADKVIDRVAGKVSLIAENYSGEPESYFLGVANKVHLEWVRTQKESQLVEVAAPPTASDDSSEIAFDCLDTCLDRLARDRRELIVSYYAGEKSSKIKLRKELWQRLGISESALHIRASRIRTRLRECVRDCLAGKAA